MQQAITKAVIPAAGLGTRLLPATKAQPKEMLVVIDKPVIQYVVEEAVQSGITDIAIIISDGKEVLREHFTPDIALEQLLEQKGKTVELEAIRALNHLANIQYIYQHEQKGLGDAILCAEDFIGKAPFAVLLGDTIIESKVPLTLELARVYAQHGSSTVSLQRVPMDIAHRYGVFVGQQMGGGLYQAIALVEKPPKGQSPSDLVFSGRYVLTPDIFRHLRNTPPGVNNEIQLTDAMRLQMQEAPLYGHVFNGRRHDVGNKLDFIKTNLLMGLNDPAIGTDLKEWLKSLGMNR
ncbi:MAG: UTP--glucose-1-phosphate uridylyltransferase [Chitinophagales bacterium]|nr:UTP--glucose-1-phosphate uridylyltransferase [Chitinophagales bacterium]